MGRFLSLLGKIGMFLANGAEDAGGTGSSTATVDYDTNFGWIEGQLMPVLRPVLYALMAVVGAAGAIYAIVLGVNLARAEDQSKRDEAKKRLITVLISVGVTIALVLFFAELFPRILNAFIDK